MQPCRDRLALREGVVEEIKGMVGLGGREAGRS